MNRDIFALLESKRTLLATFGTFWLQFQEEFGFELGDDSQAYMQLALVIGWMISDALRPVTPKGIITKSDKRTNGNGG